MGVQEENKHAEETKAEEEEEEVEHGRVLYAVIYTQDSIRERPMLFTE